MKNIVIFDLDGTLSCGKGRLNLLPDKNKAHLTGSWDEFNLAAGGDKPIVDNILMCNALLKQGFEIVILTGRCDIAKSITVKWLLDNNVKYNQLIMRSSGDHRKDTEVKESVIKSIGVNNILCAFDDLEHIAKHMRSLGVTCHLVTHYENPRVDTIERGSEK